MGIGVNEATSLRHAAGRATRCALAACVAFCVCGSLLACGDDSGNGGVSPQTYIATGIDPDTNVQDLSAAEKQRLCEEVAQAVVGVLQDPSIVGGFCTLEGIIGSLLVPPAERESACENFVANCTTPLSLPDITLLGANCGEPNPTCNATVGELETCTNAAISALDVFYLNVTCSGIAELTVTPFVPPPAGTCQDVQTRCPDLYSVPTTTAPATAR